MESQLPEHIHVKFEALLSDEFLAFIKMDDRAEREKDRKRKRQLKVRLKRQ